MDKGANNLLRNIKPSRHADGAPDRRFESLMLHLSAQFISLRAEEVDAAIEDAQRQICESFLLDRSTLWQRASAPGKMILTHLYQPRYWPRKTAAPDDQVLSSSDWILKNRGAPPIYMQMQAQAYVPWILEQIQSGKTIAIASLDDLPPQAKRDRQVLQRYEARSLVAVPLSIGHEWLGCLTFGSMYSERHWSTDSVNRFELVGHLFTNALARKVSDQAQRESEARLRALLETRKSAEESLRESEARFRMVADSAPVFIWMAGLDKRCTFINKRWLDFTGRTMEDQLGDGWTSGIHPEDLPTAYQHYLLSFDARRPFVMQYRLRRYDGEYRWVTDHGVPLFDADGHFSGFIGSCVDITERIEAEQAARDLSGRLINAQEDERARLARELHDDVTQRIARMAIDLGRFQHAPDSANLVNGVREGLVRLSEDIHAMSYELHPSVLVDLGLDESLKVECANFSKQVSIPIDVKLRDLPAGIPRNLAIGLFRIAQEALRNAARHGRASRIDVSLRGADHGLQLTVQDDGVGFNTSRHANRPSLGIAGMRERARLLGGELEIESQPGNGATVFAWVPVVE
jgi:PAS domain S-box-containing protein